jgi:NAD-dependent oxidoreductase involved in siderophore biosynthesis
VGRGAAIISAFLLERKMKIIQADPLNPKHVQDIKHGAACFADHADRPDIMPDVHTKKGRANLDQAIDRLINIDGVTIFLAIEDGICVGGAGVLITPYIFDYSRTAADELFWWADDQASPKVGMALLYQLRRHIKSQSASFCIFHHLTNSPAAVQKIYKRMGLKPLQSTYAGVV